MFHFQYHGFLYYRLSIVFKHQVDGQLNVTGTSQGKLIGLNLASDVFIGGLDMANTNLLPDGVARMADYGFQGWFSPKFPL